MINGDLSLSIRTAQNLGLMTRNLIEQGVRNLDPLLDIPIGMVDRVDRRVPTAFKQRMWESC
jgi:hypothetical protein